MDSAVLLLIRIVFYHRIYSAVEKTTDICTIFVCSPNGVDICHKIELKAPYTKQFYTLTMI
jgi:hypothetical protein